MSNFTFLQTEWPEIYESAAKAELQVFPDPRTACFYSRRALEMIVNWLYRADRSLVRPYKDDLSSLLFDPSFQHLIGQSIHAKMDVLRRLGNQAVHNMRAIPEGDALQAIRELFHVSYWLARTYARQTESRPAPNTGFNPALLPRTSPVPKQTLAQLQTLEKQLAEKDEEAKLFTARNAELQAQVEALQAEVAAALAANAARIDTHDYNESETRDFFIDLLLKEAGWPLNQTRDREYEVSGMPNNQGIGYVDYVLWGDDGRPLGLVEAKRTRRDAREGQQQAKLYADCLERQFGRRPVIFYSNGYTHWLWDVVNAPPREVQGFYKKDELELMIQRRSTRLPLASVEINADIVERYYQTRAIRRIADSFEQHRQRKALVVMATGAGKTRTVIALADLLMRCNWVKHVLFLADRVALVKQAVNAFKRHLPAASPVNLVTEKDAVGRVYISTYPTMMGLINESSEGRRRFSPGYFDFIVIDEAHRSVYQKYGAIFQYFDGLLVGLTATPKDEVDRNTYRLFNLQPGIPTDSYSLADAVKDRFLVPAMPVSVPLKFQREGISYEELSEEEKEQWDRVEWEEAGEAEVPEKVEAEAINKWLFNADTVDKVLAHVMMRGQKVAGGDRLGKTIIFAKNKDHAHFIAERFDANYSHLKGEFARVITHELDYAQTLIDDFSGAEKMPHIAISVDMLDTGIDIPEVVNLVFFKLVRSKTKFWQMIGRGTRLCPNLFGPDQHKKFFCVFDYCENFEFFKQNVEPVEGSLGQSLGKRLFKTRLALLSALDAATGETVDGNTFKEASRPAYVAIDTLPQLRQSVAATLHDEVAAMNVDNFIVRPHRKLVEKFAQPEAWQAFGEEDAEALTHQVAGLPNTLKGDGEEASRFDLLMLNIELALLQSKTSFKRHRDQVREIAKLLSEMPSIPMVNAQMPLIEEIQTDTWWQDVTVPMIENARRRLRLLVRLIEKSKRKPVYTDFEDEIGDEEDVLMPEFSAGVDMQRFREKARQFLREHDSHPAIYKLRWNLPLTTDDLDGLERIMLDAGAATPAELDQAKQECNSLGVFIRSLVGLDREAAKKEFARFLTGNTHSANQIEFINMIINYLTENGVMEAGLLYASPFTDINSKGPEGLFQPTQVVDLVTVLDEIQQRARGS